MSAVAIYERLKAEWLSANPIHTPEQYRLAMIAIAKKVGM